MAGDSFTDDFNDGIIDASRWSVKIGGAPGATVTESGGFLRPHSPFSSSAGGVVDKVSRSRAAVFTYDIDVNLAANATFDAIPALELRENATEPVVTTSGANRVAFLGPRRRTGPNHGMLLHYTDNLGAPFEWNGSAWVNTFFFTELDQNLIVHGTAMNFKFVSTATQWHMEARVTGGAPATTYITTPVLWTATLNLAGNPLWAILGDIQTTDLRGFLNADNLIFTEPAAPPTGSGGNMQMLLDEAGQPITKSRTQLAREKAIAMKLPVKNKFDPRRQS